MLVTMLTAMYVMVKVVESVRKLNDRWLTDEDRAVLNIIFIKLIRLCNVLKMIIWFM